MSHAVIFYPAHPLRFVFLRIFYFHGQNQTSERSLYFHDAKSNRYSVRGASGGTDLQINNPASYLCDSRLSDLSSRRNANDRNFSHSLAIVGRVTDRDPMISREFEKSPSCRKKAGRGTSRGICDCNRIYKKSCA